MTYRLGVDVGGTFTDFLLYNDETGAFFRNKTPSTPSDPSQAVITGAKEVCEAAGISASEISYFMHGTTVATNAVLEGKGAQVGLVVTEGYKQILQVARSLVPGGLAAWIIWPKPEPMAKLEHTVEVSGRMDAHGNELRPVDEAQVREALRQLKAEGVEAVTVCLMNSYLNGDHERKIGAIAEEVFGDVPVSLSCDILPEMYEYERALTTVANSARTPCCWPLRQKSRKRTARHGHERPSQFVALRWRTNVCGESSGCASQFADVRPSRRRHGSALGGATCRF